MGFIESLNKIGVEIPLAKTQLYQEIEKLQPEDTLQLVLEAETEEQKEFYEMVGDFLLQKKQREVIERKLF